VRQNLSWRPIAKRAQLASLICSDDAIDLGQHFIDIPEP
jgi:hypothetical protein